MRRYTLESLAGLLVAAIMAGCSGSSSAPLAPTTNNAPTDGSSLKASVPTPVSPVKDQVATAADRTSGPTLSATAAVPAYAAMSLQYRFRVFNDGGALVEDSGPVAAPVWTIPAALTANSRFTWAVRAEYQGLIGSWSPTASFMTPDPPPSYALPIGPWQQCGSRTVKEDLVSCVAGAVNPTNSAGDLEVVKRVAWLLRGEGAGLLIKNSGDNIVLWQGYSFSASRVCYPDGHLFKIILDAGPGGQNAPEWADNGFTDPTSYVPAIDPSKP